MQSLLKFLFVVIYLKTFETNETHTHTNKTYTHTHKKHTCTHKQSYSNLMQFMITI